MPHNKLPHNNYSLSLMVSLRQEFWSGLAGHLWLMLEGHSYLKVRLGLEDPPPDWLTHISKKLARLSVPLHGCLYRRTWAFSQHGYQENQAEAILSFLWLSFEVTWHHFCSIPLAADLGSLSSEFLSHNTTHCVRAGNFQVSSCWSVEIEAWVKKTILIL